MFQERLLGKGPLIVARRCAESHAACSRRARACAALATMTQLWLFAVALILYCSSPCWLQPLAVFFFYLLLDTAVGCSSTCCN